MDVTQNVAAWPLGPVDGQPAVTFEVRMTPELFGRELGTRFLKRYWYWLPILLSLLVLIGVEGEQDWIDPNFINLVILPVLCTGGMALYLYTAGWLAGRRAYYTTPIWQRPVNVVLTSSKLLIRATGFELTQDLTLLYAANETRESFHIFLNAVYVIVLPKREIPDRASLERVREYLSQGLPGTAKVKLRND
jgi:hypothetical protein